MLESVYNITQCNHGRQSPYMLLTPSSVPFFMFAVVKGRQRSDLRSMKQENGPPYFIVLLPIPLLLPESIGVLTLVSVYCQAVHSRLLPFRSPENGRQVAEAVLYQKQNKGPCGVL